MKILYCADIHAHPCHLETIIKKTQEHAVDCLIIGGDLITIWTRFADNIILAQKEFLEEEFIPKLQALNKAMPSLKVYLDMGNDDLVANRPLLEKSNGKDFYLIHMKKTALTEDIDIVGYMCVPPTPFGIKDWEKPDKKGHPHAPQEIRTEGYTSISGSLVKTRLDLFGDDTIENDLKILSSQIDKPFIFVAHCPPYKTKLDMLKDGTHVGSLAIREFIEYWAEKEMLLASFHGHIHESHVVSGSISDNIGNVICLNPGQSNTEETKYVLFDTEDINLTSIDLS